VEALQYENEKLRAKLRLREQQLYGKSSEKKRGADEKRKTCKECEKKRPRGQQRGAAGHGRRLHDNLPVVSEVFDLDDDKKVCKRCGLPFEEMGKTEDSEEVIIEVRAHRRRIKRKRYKQTCRCPGTPGIITAPAPAKLIPKGGYHISFWVEVIIWKFQFQIPTHRFLQYMRLHCDLAVSQGTVTDGLRRLYPLFDIFERPIHQHCVNEHHWHADETRWPVFSDEVCNNRWYLWVFRSTTAAVYILDPSRSSAVPENFFGELARGIISADRYSAYKVLLADGRILIAFCWAHVRRDFLSFARQWPKDESWGLSWVDKIGELYHLNHLRLEHEEDSPQFVEADARLSLTMDGMKETYEKELVDESLHPAKRKVLTSLKKHWSGLSLFVTRPWLPMDNSEAERKLRPSAVGRKNYYGSGSVWSGFMMATLLSVLQTLLIWNINLHSWLISYLTACAENGGRAPDDFESFLPWNMSEERLSSLRMKSQDTDHPLPAQERDTS